MEKVRIINSWSNSSVSRVGKPDEVIVGAKYAVFKDPLDDYEVREDFYDSCGSEGTEEASEQKRQKPWRFVHHVCILFYILFYNLNRRNTNKKP